MRAEQPCVRMDPAQDQPRTEGIGQGAVLMNHGNELEQLATVLKINIIMFEGEINQIKDQKHRIDLIQTLDKAKYYMLKMYDSFDNLNQWLTAFGVDGNAQNP